jgi:hypothetical protein
LCIFVLHSPKDQPNDRIMRTRYTSITLALCLPLGMAMAQTLDNGNNTPVAGDQFTYYQSGYMDPGATGASQTWDYSMLSSGASANFTYVTPASTGHAATFPGSTVAADAGQGNFVFYTGSATGFELRGLYSATLGDYIVYQNPEQLFAYPCSYNTTWTDQFSANFSSFGTNVARAGTVTGVADGYGTLIMPYGTVTNVLRVKITEDYSDVLSGIGSIDYDFISYNWMRPGTRVPLLTFNDNVTNQLGTPQESQTGLWLDGGAIGMEEALRYAIGVELFPNPASGQVAVVYSSEGGSLRLELIDGTGRLVRSEGVTAAMGIARHDLDLGGLSAGLYQVRVVANNGQMGIQRLVVQ